MTHRIDTPFLTCFIILMMLSLVSCSGGGNTGEPAAATGTLELSLMDSPNSYKAVYITINEVHVHHESDGWETLSDLEPNLPQTLDLLELVNGTMFYLGTNELADGHYNQMRLVLEDSTDTPPPGDLNINGNPHPYYNYLVDDAFNEIALKVPSGGNTGIKLVGGFDIESGGATELILDFDAHKSIVQAGNSGKWLLKPTIKVVETVTNSVSGTITESENGPIEAAMVQAQKYNPDSSDPADQVVTASGTVSDEIGDYFMYLPLLSPKDTPYNIIATKSGYEAACRRLPSKEPMGYIENFSLIPIKAENTGTITASVKGLSTEDDFAVFSFRQIHGTCDDIEVASIRVSNMMSSDPITFPAGTYKIVVSADGQETKVEEENYQVNGGQDYLVDVTF